MVQKNGGPRGPQQNQNYQRQEEVVKPLSHQRCLLKQLRHLIANAHEHVTDVANGFV